MLNLRQLIEFIINDYPLRNSPAFNKAQFKGNSIVNVLNKGLNGIENKYIFLTEDYVSKGSAGQGNWAVIPWIGLFDKKVSTSAEKGFDIVYLFSADLERVYLSLNQGWSFYNKTYGRAKGLTNIQKVAKYWQMNLINKTSRMSTGNIDLGASQFKGTKLPEGYERGNILSIEYNADNLPTNEIMITDLLDMKVLLKELKLMMVSYDDIGQSIKYVLNQQSFSVDEEKVVYEVSQFDTKQKNIKLTEGPKEKLERVLSSRHINKTDYELKEKVNSKIGFSGEILILNYERQKLIDAGRNDLAEKVEQVSETQGDGLGYDIKSYDVQGNSVFIEVKATTGDIDTPFYLSENELNMSHNHKDEYVLARVYDLLGNCRFYIVTGDLSEKLKLKPKNYIAFPKDDN